MPTNVVTVSSVAASATNVTLLAQKLTRALYRLHNDSNATMYVRHGGTASKTAFTYKLVPDAYFELTNADDCWGGSVVAIWDAVAPTGFARLTEEG